MPELIGQLLPPGLQQSTLTTGYPGLVGLSNIGLNVAKLAAQPPAFLVEGYKERWRWDGEQEVIAVYDVPWTGRKNWVDYMLGYSTSLQLPNQPPTITRSIPYQCPEPGYQHLYCQELETTQLAGIMAPAAFLAFQGNGAPQPPDANGNLTWTQWLRYNDPSVANGDGLIRYVAHFRPFPFEVRTDAEMLAIPNSQGELERYVERRPRGSLQALPLPTGKLQWVTGSFMGTTVQDNAAYLLLPMEELIYVWHQVPDPPWAAIYGSIGQVNANPFDGARSWPFTYPAGTLLMQAPLKDRYRHTNGRIYWRITYSFLYRPQGHNYLPDAKGQFNQVAFNGDPTQPLYPSADFNALFKPPAPVTYQ